MRRNFNWLYPLGFLGLGFVDTLFTQWIVYLHAPPGSADPHAASGIGTMLLVSYVLQGLLNPALGHVSDRLNHPWGRRLPFILLGALPMALLFYLLWQVTAFWPSLLLLSLYGLLFVAVVQPYVAMLPTIAPDPAVRVRYSLVGGVFSLIASGLALVAGPWLLEQGSFAIFGWLGGLALVLTVFVPALLMRELPAASEQPAEPETGMLAGMLALLRDRPLACFIAGNACVVLTMIALTILAPFLCETLLGQTRAYTSVANLYALGGVVAAVAYVGWRGKQLSFMRLLRNMAALDGAVLLAYGALSFVYQIPLPFWHLCFVLVGGLVLVGMMAPNLILAEFSDQDTRARQGVIFGLNGLAISLANACSSKTTSVLLNQGTSATDPLGVQLGLIFAGSSAILAAFALTAALRAQSQAPHVERLAEPAIAVV